MKKIAFFASLLLLCITASLLASCVKDPGSPGDDTGRDEGTSDTAAQTEETTNSALKDIYIHAISELNTKAYALDSHASFTSESSLELNFRDYYEYRSNKLIAEKPYYPRIKKISEDKYLLFYQNATHGSDIYVAILDGLGKVNSTKMIYSRYPASGDTRYFANCDACVLKNGDVLTVASFRAKTNYANKPAQNGLVIRRSRDKGVTWEPEQIVYYGTTWEPYIYQDPESEEIQIYWTNTNIYPIEGGETNGSSGVAIIRSLDNGYTWTSDLSKTYSGQIVSQTATQFLNGRQFYSDQMPCAIKLHNGKIALALETRNTTAGNYKYTISFSSDNWARALNVDETGPADKRTNLFSAAGPYLRQFLSGEVVLTYHWSGYLNYKMANADATVYGSEYAIFDGAGNWGATEIDGDHSLIATIGFKDFGIMLGRLYLNHRVFPEKATPVIDGDNADWENNTDALFIGSETQAQCSIRFAYDDDNIYILTEALDDYVNSADKTAFYIAGGEKGNIYTRVTVSVDGSITAEAFEGGIFTKINNSGISNSVYVSGTMDENGDKDRGYIIELKVPRSAINAENADIIRFDAILFSKDTSVKSITDTFDSCDISSPATWFKIPVAK